MSKREILGAGSVRLSVGICESGLEVDVLVVSAGPLRRRSVVPAAADVAMV